MLFTTFFLIALQAAGLASAWPIAPVGPQGHSLSPRDEQSCFGPEGSRNVSSDLIVPSTDTSIQMVNAVLRAMLWVDIDWLSNIIDGGTCETKLNQTAIENGVTVEAGQGKGDNWYDAIMKGVQSDAETNNGGQTSFPAVWQLMGYDKDKHIPDHLSCDGDAENFDLLLMSRMTRKEDNGIPDYKPLTIMYIPSALPNTTDTFGSHIPDVGFGAILEAEEDYNYNSADDHSPTDPERRWMVHPSGTNSKVAWTVNDLCKAGVIAWGPSYAKPEKPWSSGHEFEANE